MGKTLDSRVCEYAYAENIYGRYNIGYKDAKGSAKYKHEIGVLYVLKDTDKTELEKVRKFHTIDNLETMDTISQIVGKVNTNLPIWIAADKLELSGYSG